ncbi:type 1 fimbrial protein [Burkholderia contaminans]|nr:type 1 fimbrial protein [Burkholderia contaminans]MBH9666010.1 type 1 fimbrial protein [Burkholderia contaminans]MBH9674440.1 type 1 fimbrial protein [Burkholderia contaminans]MBH9704486.1 type 1 fimbrial protein [Burkholderia contaminans]MBH9719055.1 type 1 fimbrial protein [Burkholderia contaminans]
MPYAYSSSESHRLARCAGNTHPHDSSGDVARRMARLIAVASTFLLACAAFATDAAAASLYAFGQATVSSPSNAPPGTAVARHYFTPQDVCGASTCDITSISMYNKGSVVGVIPGPDLETNVSGLSTRMLIDGTVAVSSTKTTLRNTLEVVLFRDSRQPKDGSLNSGWLSAYYRIYYKSGILGESSEVFLAAKVSFINGTCSIPDQTVTLPPVQHHVFNGVGSTAGATDFQVQLNNCPAGYNRIGYQLAPLDDMVVGAPGGMHLRPDAKASGIGIQIADGATGQPLTLRKSHTVTNYNRATGGSPSIPLRASYLQTGAKIGGGSVHAAAQVLLDYQ